MIILGILLLILGLIWLRPLAYVGVVLIALGALLAITATGGLTGYGYY